jgi:hypothetical protein
MVPVPRATTADGLFSMTANSPVVTTAEAVLGNYTVPANYLAVGTTLEIVAFGVLTTTAVLGTLSMRLRRGGVAGTQLALLSNNGTALATTNSGWSARWLLTCRTAGPTGTVLADGTFWSQYGGAPTATFGPARSAGTTAAVTWDTTTQATLDLTAIWSVASQSITATQILVSLLRA